MSSADVAAYLGISEDTVRRWVKSGKLPPVNPKHPSLQRAKAYRFRKADVDRIASTTYPAPAAGHLMAEDAASYSTE